MKIAASREVLPEYVKYNSNTDANMKSLDGVTGSLSPVVGPSRVLRDKAKLWFCAFRVPCPRDRDREREISTA